METSIDCLIALYLSSLSRQFLQWNGIRQHSRIGMEWHGLDLNARLLRERECASEACKSNPRMRIQASKHHKCFFSILVLHDINMEMGMGSGVGNIL